MKILLLITGVVLLLLTSASAAEPPREADVILKEYQAIKVPMYDSVKMQDPEFSRTYREERTTANNRQNELALELYRNHPAHERAVEFMITRWTNMREDGVVEMEQFLKDHPDSPLGKEVLYTRARVMAFSSSADSTRRRDCIDEFIRAYPKDGRGVSLLNYLALFSKDKENQLTIYRRIAADYAGSRAAKVAEGNIRRVDGLGKPFELSFTDAMAGRPVSIKGLHGKVVVIDFWSTTCGPCIADMPRLKELYAKYKDQGVEFVGVSLDVPGDGLVKMKEFVEKNGIPWPQYYQGKAWDSEFSQSWGINMIPQLFIVDADGNLHSTEARSKLDTLIPELIKKRDQKS